MPIISVGYNENNRWKGKVWYKVCCKNSELVKDADN